MTARTPQHPVGCTCLDGRYCAEQAFGPDDDGRTPDPWAELRRLAEAATPGPWTVSLNGSPEGTVMDAAGYAVALCMVRTSEKGTNGRYIAAASPDRVSGLLAERDRLREVVEAARAYVTAEDRWLGANLQSGAGRVADSAADALRHALDALDTGEARRGEHRPSARFEDGSPPVCVVCDETWPCSGVEGGASEPTVEDFRGALLKECDDARNVGIRPARGRELEAWNYVVTHFEQFVRQWPRADQRIPARGYRGGGRPCLIPQNACCTCR